MEKIFLQSADASDLQFRQEIKDRERGIIADPVCGDIIQSIENFTFDDFIFHDNGNPPSGDIKAIYYNIHDQVLDSTIWFSNRFSGYNLTSFAIVIDADSNPYTGRDGIEYKLEVHYSDETSTWLKSLIELSPIGTSGERVIEYNNNFTNINFTEGYVSLSLDLKEIGFPTNFRIMSYSAIYLKGDETEKSNIFDIEYPTILVDVTDWIEIPPYKYSIKTNDPIIIRQGEEKIIGGKILTDKKTQFENVKIFNIFNYDNNNIKLKLDNSYDQIYDPNTPLPIVINAPTNTPIGEYKINLFANSTKKISIPKAFLMGAFENFDRPNCTKEILIDGEKVKVIPSLSKISKFVREATTFNETFTMPISVDLSVIKQYSGEEVFSQFWNIYGDPISLIAGGFAAGFSALIFDRIKNKSHNRNKKLDDYY